MNVPSRKPALTKALVREHPVAPTEVAATAESSSNAGALHPVNSAPPAERAPRGMGTMTFRVDLDLRHEVKRHAFDHEKTVQTVIAEALREYLAKHT